MTDTPTPTPEGQLIGEHAAQSGRSIRSLATDAGISDTRWRQIVVGWQSTRAGIAEARASAQTLARMAAALGIPAERLEHVGRSDAANALRSLTQKRGRDEAGVTLSASSRRPASVVYLVVAPSGGVVHAGVDREAAEAHAMSIRGILTVVPVLADHRTATDIEDTS